jgi:hypothetical protein
MGETLMNQKFSPPKAPSDRRWWAALLMFISPLPTHAATEGELWENTTTIQGPSSRMELGAQRDCHPMNWFDSNGFEAHFEGGCRSELLQRQADGFSWRILCEDGRHGSATTRRLDANRIDTDLVMQTPEGGFQLHVDSRRLGSCSNPKRND